MNEARTRHGDGSRSRRDGRRRRIAGRRLIPTLPPLLAAALCPAGEALAQSAAPGASIQLPPVAVVGEPLTASEQAEDRLDAMAGGTAVVSRRDYGGAADVSIGEALGSAPGVVVQDFFGGNDQPRLQIRGSGLQQSPVQRGVLVLKDGMPLNRADGSYIMGLIDPAQAEFIEVYRGHTANRLGTSVLGGGINLVSPTGHGESGGRITATAGSFGEVGGLAEFTTSVDRFDLVGQVSALHRDGFRDHNTSERLNANANLGVEVNDVVTTRFYLGTTDLRFDIPGPLPESDLDDDPTRIYAGPTVSLGPTGATVSRPGPNVERDRPYRETRQLRIANRTTALRGSHLYEAGLGYSYTDDAFMAPIASGLTETAGGDVTGILKYAYAPDDRAVLPLFEATAFLTYGEADRTFYQNVGGEKGARIGDNALSSTTLSWQAGFNIPVGANLNIKPAVALSYAERSSDDNYGAGTRPVVGYNPVTRARQSFVALSQDTGYSREYAGVSPSLGATYDILPGQTLFASVSRSFEPPTHDDLLATVNGSPYYSPGAPANGVLREAFATPDLDAQTGTTVEAGARGDIGRVQWDATVYYSWIENELLSLRDSSGTRLAATNADRTTHFGAELGVAARLTETVSLQATYTYQDFRFDDDPTHGDNRLAGAPDHVINAALRYDVLPNLYLETEVNWLPGTTPVDNANTAFADSWATVNLRGGYEIDRTFSLKGEVTNLFDSTYASSVLVTDAAQSDQASYIPGDGRAARLSLTARF